MPTLTKGSFSLNLGIVQLGGELSDADRQSAWELYTELSTRVAVTGKPSDPECTNFDGELYIESLDSLYAFFREARGKYRCKIKFISFPREAKHWRRMYRTRRRNV